MPLDAALKALADEAVPPDVRTGEGGGVSKLYRASTSISPSTPGITVRSCW